MPYRNKLNDTTRIRNSIRKIADNTKLNNFLGEIIFSHKYTIMSQD